MLLKIMLTIINETTNFIKSVVFGKTVVFGKKIVFGKTIVFEKKLHATLPNVVLHEVNKLWGSRAKTY